MTSTKPKRAKREWRIKLVRAKGQYLGLVEAPDETAAIAEVIKLFIVPEGQRSRPIARPVE